jgi:hypothetical protein
MRVARRIASVLAAPSRAIAARSSSALPISSRTSACIGTIKCTCDCAPLRDGSECDWGRVLVWDPPSRIVLSWEISADWKHDPHLKTEVEVRFVADGENRTRVELEHRGLDAYGARRDEMRGIFDSDTGWKGLLDAFAARASEGSRI